MRLFKNNKTEWDIPELKVLDLFQESPLYRENNRPEAVRLALFICRQTPLGLQSSFRADEFNNLYEMLKQRNNEVTK